MSRNRRDIDDDPNEDDEWLFDSIVTFLSSPIWSIPIQHFIEKNCEIFSPNDGWSGGALLEDDDDEDETFEKVPTEYLDIHLKYKDLVDVLIKAFLQDLGVTYNQFLRACKKTSRFNQHPVYLELFEQVWCADNFKLFKAQMIRKNVELELQALILLQHQLGLIKSSNHDDKKDQEDEIMTLVIKKSKDEYDLIMNNRNKTNDFDLPIQKAQDLETAKKIVKSDVIDELKTELDKNDYLSKKIVEEQLIKKPNDLTPSSFSRFRPTSAKKNQVDDVSSRFNDDLKLDDRNKIKKKNYDDDDDIVSNNASDSASASAAKLANNLTQNILAQNGKDMSENEIRRRAEFMQKQRELLAEKKKQERQKQLDKFMRESEKSGEPVRPMSSRAARSVLSGAEPSDIKKSNSSNESEDERKKIEARRALAEILKKEVINNSKK